MVGEGNRYIENRTREALRNAARNYLIQTRNSKNAMQLGRVNASKDKATLPDGSEIDIITSGDLQPVSYVFKDGTAYSQQHNRGIIGGNLPPPAYLMFRDDDGLYVRKVGQNNLFRVPNLLSSNIDPTNYTGGFSADLKHLFMAGVYVSNNPANEATYDEESPTQTIVEWYILSDFDLTQEEVIYESSSSGSVILDDVFENSVLPEISAPTVAAQGSEGVETPGLAGTDRAKHIYRYWPEDSSTTVTTEDIEDFIQDIADLLEVSFDEALTLFPDNVLQQGVDSASEANRFFPFTRQEFDEDSGPTILTVSGSSSVFTISEVRTGFWNRTWVEVADQLKPRFMEIGFAFNVNRSNQPVLDVIATYQTVTIYGISSHEMEEWEYYDWQNEDPSNSNTISYDLEYGRLDNRDWGYGGISQNYHWEDVDIAAGGTGSLDYTAIPIDPNEEIPGGSSLNFRMYSGGRSVDFAGDIDEGNVTFYSVLYFNKYHSSAENPLGNCHEDTTSCIYYPQVGNDVADRLVAIEPARGAFFGGVGPLAQPLALWQFPMENATRTTERFDGTAVVQTGVFTDTPSFFPAFTSPSEEPSFAGLFLNDFGQSDAFANAYQFGRAVMSIKQINLLGTSDVSYIDRPPAASNDHDKIINTYLGIDGGRASIVKETEFEAYAYNKNYVDTSGQVIKLEPPDAMTEALFFDAGTYPIAVTALKGYNTNDFFQYGTSTVNEQSYEFVDDVTVGLDGSITYNIQRSGTLQNTPGVLIDFATSRENRISS